VFFSAQPALTIKEDQRRNKVKTEKQSFKQITQSFHSCVRYRRCNFRQQRCNKGDLFGAFPDLADLLSSAEFHVDPLRGY
jgi:hypothetical protein